MRSHAADKGLESIAGRPFLDRDTNGVSVGAAVADPFAPLTFYLVYNFYDDTQGGDSVYSLGGMGAIPVGQENTVGFAGGLSIRTSGTPSGVALKAAQVRTATLTGTTEFWQQSNGLKNGPHVITVSMTQGLLTWSTWVDGVLTGTKAKTTADVLGGFPTRNVALAQNNRPYMWPFRAVLYNAEHTPSQRRRIEQWLLAQAGRTLPGISAPLVASRDTGGTTSNIAGQSTASVEPLTMYCAYTADGTMSANYPTLLQVYSDSGRRAIFQGRPAGSNGFGCRIDTTGAVNQAFSTTTVGREAGAHVIALRIAQGGTSCDYWVDGFRTGRTLIPGDGIGRTTVYLSNVTTTDVSAKYGMFYNQFHSDVQVNLISAWLRRSIAL